MGTNDDESDRTLYCGNLHEKVTEELLYELFLQAGPLEKVKIVPGKSFSFITFKHEVSVPYTIQLMQGVALFGRTLKLQFRGRPGGNGANPGDLGGQYHRSMSAPDFRQPGNEMHGGYGEPQGYQQNHYQAIQDRQDRHRSRHDSNRAPYRPSHSEMDMRSRSRHQRHREQDQEAQLAQNIEAQLMHLRNMQAPQMVAYPQQQQQGFYWQQPPQQHQQQRWNYR